MDIPNINDANLVFLVQDFGFNHCFWNPPFELEQLAIFWSKLPQIESSSITSALGGTLLCIEKTPNDRDFEDYYNYFQEINKELLISIFVTILILI